MSGNDLVKIDNFDIDVEKLDNTLVNLNETYRLCSPIANMLTDLNYNSLAELNEKRKKTKIIIGLVADDDKDYTNINYLDKMVLNAVCTLCCAGQYVFTTRQIYETLSGSTKKIPLKKDGSSDFREIISIINDSMEKLNSSKIYISQSVPKSTETNKKVLEDSDTIKARILDYIELESIRGGKKVNVFNLGEKNPLLLDEAINKGQIYAVSSEICNLPVSATWQSCLIRDYLIGRIEALKNSRNQQYQQSILCERIYEVIDIDGQYFSKLASDNSRTVTKKRLRELAKKIMKNWIKIGYIKDFTEYKNGRQIEGFILFFDDETQAIIDNKKAKIIKK